MRAIHQVTIYSLSHMLLPVYARTALATPIVNMAARSRVFALQTSRWPTVGCKCGMPFTTHTSTSMSRPVRHAIDRRVEGCTVSERASEWYQRVNGIMHMERVALKCMASRKGSTMSE